MTIMTMIRDRHILVRLAVLLTVMTAAVQWAWAADDTFTVNSETSTTRGSTIYTGTYTSLTLGFSSDAGGTPNEFKLTNDYKTIGGEQNPHFNGSSVPDGGHVFVLTTSQPGDFVFHVKLNSGKTMSLRNNSGVDVATKANSSNSSKDFEWKVTVESAGTYYLFARGSKLELFGYTFTKKPIQGITQLPYSADFSSDTEPFDGGERASGTYVSNVFRVQNRTATATFQGGHTLKGPEMVNISFTAYHGYLNNGGGVTVTLYNTANEPLISYHYHQPTQNITDVSFGGETVAGFVAFPGASFFAKDGSGNNRWANGLTEGTKPYKVGSGTYNPLITMTVSGSGQVTFSLKTSEAGINRSFSEVISDRVVDLGKIVIVDANNNADRCFAMDDLSITSQLYSYDYENTGGLTDWTTATAGRYTPIIAEDALTGNHYMTVNQDQRYNNGTILTNNSISGSALAGENFTLEFDMKLGRSNRDQHPTAFTVYASDNTTKLFTMADKNTDGNKWDMKVAGHDDAEEITLAGNATGGIDAITWHHYKLSYTGGRLYVTITSLDGATCYKRAGYNVNVSGLSKMTFDTKRYYANFAFDNLKVSAYANTNFSVSGKTETYTISSIGDLPQVDEGKTISIEYGVAEQVQMTTTEGTIGAYSLDANVVGKFSQAYSEESPTSTSIPDRGTYYKFIPKFAGKLSISGWVNSLNNVTLQKSDGTIINTYTPSNTDVFNNQLLDVELQADTEYYLYASTPKTANCETSNSNYPTLFLTGFKFEQSSMNREIKVSDLLYTENTNAADGKLNREIPGFQLSYSGDANVQTTANGQGLTISNGGSITIKLRENGYAAKISNITLNISEVSSATVNSESITVTGKHSFTISPAAATATLSCTEGSLTITSLSVGYTGDDDNNTAMWLDDEKTTAPTLTFSNNHLMRVAGDGQAFTQTPTVSPTSFNAALTYTSDNNTIATINSDGTNGQLLKSGEATITATFAGTDYFNSATASYAVSNVLKNGESYSRAATANDVVRINAKAAGADKALSLTGTQDVSFTLGTASSDNKTTATGTTVTLTNGSGSDITIERLRIYAKNPVAYLYYEGQENNYSMQMQFLGFNSGSAKGFRVLDIGDPTDPIDLTDTYQMDGNYVWTDGTNVTTTLGGTFSIDDGSFTASSQVIGEGAVLPTVSHALTRKAGAPSDGYSSSLTATANIFIAKPSDTDGDSTYDTYHVWDMTTSVSASGQMDSRWRWDAHGYYQAWMPEYLPILNNNGETLAGNEGLLVKGDLRYHTGSTGLRLNLTSVNASLKFPVKKGMEVKIVMSSSAADISHIINNVTTTTGDATNTLYIEKEGINVTAYYLAKEDGAVEIRSMDKQGAYVKSITLQVPRIHFDEEIVTVQATGSAYTVINLPNNTGDATLTYTIAGEYTLPTTYNGDGTSVSSGTVATSVATDGKVTITGNEGYAIINVENVSATGVQPRKGSYRLYVIDFKYDPATDILTDLSAINTESTYGGYPGDYPTGYNKVVQPVTYSITFSDGARGQLVQESRTNPRFTTFTLSAYSPGTISLKATTGRISTTRTLTLGGYAFKEVAPVVTLEELKAHNWIYTNDFPDGFTPTSVTVDMSGDAHCTAAAIEDGKIKLTMAETTGGGALRVNATDASSNTIHFVLTIAYPASKGKKWNFYQMKNYDDDNDGSTPVVYGLKIGKIDDYDSDKNQVKEGVTITGTNTWTTTGTNWDKIFRKGEEQPRWAYRSAMRGDNGFVVEETAGLVIDTGKDGFYIDNPVQPDEFAFNHIGLHNNASVTIPQLKKGDYIALNLDRVLPNNGAILSATNAVDLAGNTVDHTFTISRSQTDYQNAGATVKDASGARVIPGYYTFRAAADGDVTFTLEDEGYLNILSIEIYNDDAEYSATRDPSNGYHYTMTDIKVDDYPAYSTPVPTMLKEDDDTQVIDLAICNVLLSTSVGPAEYVVMDEVGNLNATLENVEWTSDRGALYNKGRITVNEGYGKLLIRMNNYTAEGRYLIGYTPTYSLTVGHPPHQDYPFTWNFENISGGAVKSKNNNAYNSISTDYYTWKNLGYETYLLDTRTSSGSLYVQGATLVTGNRDLGQKGEISYLNANNYGCDEFNGLGFNGQITFKLAQQGTEANDAPQPTPENPWKPGTVNQLLRYTFAYAASSTEDNAYTAQGTTVDGNTTWTSAELKADDGTITFGSPGKRETPASSITRGFTSATFAYKMDGGNTKNALLKPQRPLQEGDVITLHGYSTANVLLSGFSFYAGANDNANDALVTINWSSSTATAEQEIVYTVKQGDGLAGRSEVYLFRANKQYTVYLTEVKIEGPDASAPTAYERALTCNGDVTVTIPDLLEGHYVYIKSSATPKTIPSNLKAAVAEDGLDAIEDEAVGDIHKHVYKYKVIAGGNTDVTFASGTKIYRIGVTNIMKPLARVGNGDAWATESRDHAIDYTQTGAFTVNDIKANTVTAKNYGLQKLTVQMNEKTDAMPAQTGMVLKLKLKYTTDDEKSAGVKMTTEEASTATTNAVANLAKANSSGVPLFYPPYSATILNSAVVGFRGTEGNLMKDNVTSQTFTSETEYVDAVNYTRFIFAQRYMQWKKENGVLSPTPTSFTESGDLPVFYRLHLYNSTEASALSSTVAELNTLGANKAYMLIRTGNVPKALWDTSSSARSFIGIAGVSDMGEITGITEHSERPASAKSSAIYDLRGQCMGNDEKNLAPGIYIRNGKKFVIR